MAEKLDDIVADYTEESVVIAQKHVYRGPDEIRKVFTQLLSDLPQAQWEVEPVWAGDTMFLGWKGRSGNRRVDDGVDTFIFREGKIVVQTVRYTLQTA